ncbi:hypothetical protein [Aestuariivivens sediminis]|uniref:hypothetical protein n=1 Tax=Aestuariivivens sediminis TaxID=2913557 RepID=UPI001F56CE47|nr:hypothetical protein [Aestuariivivens sediminis]
MPTQAEREAQFIWRPNDNSSTTLTRYSQEARHWVKAVNEAQRESNRPSFQDTIGVIGLLLSLGFNLIWLLGYLLVKFFKWVSK